MTLRVAVLVAVAMAGGVHSAFACFLLRGDPHALVRDADVIVRARASAVRDQPALSSIRSEAGRLVHLGVLEQLKGEALLFDEGLLFSVTAEGTLTDRPDMNQRPVPYGMVRRGGLGGGCYALNYQHGGEYLLLLKRVDGKLTPYWAPLGATNEQISGERDPWVAWVRQELESIRREGRSDGASVFRRKDRSVRERGQTLYFNILLKYKIRPSRKAAFTRDRRERPSPARR